MCITKVGSLLNNLISFSKDQLKQIGKLDLLLSEKQQLKLNFNVEKHHHVIALNICLFLQRQGLFDIDLVQSKGRRYIWTTDKVNYMIDQVIPKVISFL